MSTEQLNNSTDELQSPSSADKISQARLNKQMEYLHQLNRPFQVRNRNEVVFPNLLDNQKTLHVHLPKEYPFKQPMYTIGDEEERLPVSEVIEEWAPKIKIFELIELLAIRINERAKITQKVSHYTLLKAFHSPRAITFIFVIAIALRICLALGPYSGFNDYPNLGDFEAHRNWMSITLNRAITSWYQEHEDQPWWRIDYPPIAAYISYLFGKVYQHIEPDAMRLQFGYESQSLKVYMRFTTLLVDMVLVFPALYLLSTLFNRKLPQIFLLILLIKPDAIFIDHGHFQYNDLVLGLILLSFYCLLTERYYLTCFLFTISIHAKQMSVYYSLAFLSALIGLTYQQLKYDKVRVIVELLKYGMIVMIVSLLIWLPWLGTKEDLNSVITAIFPVHRGLYQLKVGNFWCITDTILQWEKHFSKSVLVALCFLSSVFFSIPSMVSMILHPTRRTIVIGFAAVSMTFFMFSYHVHEKSILLPLAVMPFVGEIIGGWLAHEVIVAGCVGMFYLLKEDGQLWGYFGLGIIYILISGSYTMLKQRVRDDRQDIQVMLQWHHKIYDYGLFRYLFIIVLIGLHAIALIVPPPLTLPYLWNLVLALFTFCFNCYFLFLANSLQLQWILSTLRGQHPKRT